MELFGLSQKELIEILIPIAVIIGALIIALILKKIIFVWLSRLSKKTKWRGDEIVIDAIKCPFVFWVVAAAIYIALDLSKLPENVVLVSGRILLALVILSITMVAANIAGKFMVTFSKKKDVALPTATLTRNIVKTAVYVIGVLLLLSNMGISITPLLGALGIGSLAVALALQDTLSNMFSGFYMVVGKYIRIGDFIKLDSGEEGYVVDIGWRATKIRMLPNNIVLIPNSKLSQAKVVNYHMPEREMAVLVQVGVHYDSDLTHVEKVTIDVGKEVMKEVPGGVSEFTPFIRYHTFDDSSINFTVILRANEFVDNYLVKHEFIKRLHQRYKKEGIVIPYPIRAINYGQEKVGEK